MAELYGQYMFTFVKKKKAVKEFARVVIPFNTFLPTMHERSISSTCSPAYDMIFYFSYSGKCFVIIYYSSMFIFIFKK